MLARKRSKLRRRDIASHRYFQQTCGYERSRVSRAVNVVPERTKAAAEQSRKLQRSTVRQGESKMILRFEGDSIAYFWALEVETAISHRTLRGHWQELANALAGLPWG